jgi:uncharacterized OB-fold protein
MALIDALEAVPTGARPRQDPDSGRLVGARCADCATPSWPARAVCHRCGGGQMREEAFSPDGTLLTYTTVWIPRPGLEAPYVLGQVLLDDNGPQVFAHLRELPDDTTVPYPVRVVIGSTDVIPPYWFVPRDGDGS